MRTTTTIIIGGGPAGLAMSHRLADHGVDHVVLERGQVAQSWRSERWDSLRLLTPNWQTRLPGWQYRGPDPDGYMTMPEVIGYLAAYSESFAAPVQEQTTVLSVRPDVMSEGFYRVDTDQGSWRCRTVVIATGACGKPSIPAAASMAMPGSIHQLAPNQYRNPNQIADGGVLVVGASASGLQLSAELQAAGHDVTLAVGSHTRLPRTYRGMDVQWWLDAMGVLDRSYDEVPDIDAARRAPSLQLVGTPDQRTLDLGRLADHGVRLAGRLTGVDNGVAHFSGDLAATCAHADTVQTRLLDRIDAWADRAGLVDEILPADRPPTLQPGNGLDRVSLESAGIRTVLWATGFHPHNPWLDVPITDRSGAIRHDGGVTPAPGVYVLGLPFLRRRKSTFLDGFGADANDLAGHLVGHLNTTAACAA